MKYVTTSISTIEQGNSNLYNKILTIRKIGTSAVYGTRLNIKLRIDSYISSLWESGEKKETYINISQFKFQNDTSDDRNTFLEVSDSKDIKVKFLEDNDYIYLYCQNSDLTYGNRLIVDVIESEGDVLRVKFNEYACYEEIPNTLTELSFNIIGGYDYRLNKGSSDWSLLTKIIELKIPLTKTYTQFHLTVKASTPNALMYQKCLIYVSTQSGQSMYNFIEGRNKIYIEETTDENYKYVNIYTSIFASGVRTIVTLNNCINLKNEYINIITNNEFASIDTSTFIETSLFTKYLG